MLRRFHIPGHVPVGCFGFRHHIRHRVVEVNVIFVLLGAAILDPHVAGFGLWHVTLHIALVFFFNVIHTITQSTFGLATAMFSNLGWVAEKDPAFSTVLFPFACSNL